MKARKVVIRVYFRAHTFTGWSADDYIVSSAGSRDDWFAAASAKAEKDHGSGSVLDCEYIMDVYC